MKKGWAIILVLFCLCVCGIWLITKDSMNEKKDQNELVINGSEIKDAEIRIYYLEDQIHSDLPIIAVLKALGYSPEWINSDAVFEIRGKKYILSLSEKKFYQQEKGPKVNYLLPPPGSDSFVCEIIGDDLLVDDSTVWSVLYLSGLSVDIHIDIDNRTVYICEQSSDRGSAA